MKPLIYPYSVLRAIPTFRCNFDCVYCSCSKYQEELCRISLYTEEELDKDKWIERFQTLEPQRLPLLIVFCAGEPPLYKGLADIINTLDKKNWRTSIYTNLSMMKEIRKMTPRENLYFYVSYHPMEMKREVFIRNAIELQASYRVLDFHAVPAPEQVDILREDAREMAKKGIHLKWREHPYIITKQNEYGFYDEIGEQPKFKNRFASRISGVPMKTVYCKTSFNHHTGFRSGLCYPIAPNGDVYTCWRHMLNHSKEGVLGNFFDDEFEFVDEYYECNYYGDCCACAWDKNIVDKETGRQIDTDVVAWESI